MIEQINILFMRLLLFSILLFPTCSSSQPNPQILTDAARAVLIHKKADELKLFEIFADEIIVSQFISALTRQNALTIRRLSEYLKVSLVNHIDKMIELLDFVLSIYTDKEMLEVIRSLRENLFNKINGIIEEEKTLSLDDRRIHKKAQELKLFDLYRDNSLVGQFIFALKMKKAISIKRLSQRLKEVSLNNIDKIIEFLDFVITIYAGDAKILPDIISLREYLVSNIDKINPIPLKKRVRSIKAPLEQRQEDPGLNAPSPEDQLQEQIRNLLYQKATDLKLFQYYKKNTLVENLIDALRYPNTLTITDASNKIYIEHIKSGTEKNFLEFLDYAMGLYNNAPFLVSLEALKERLMKRIEKRLGEDSYSQNQDQKRTKVSADATLLPINAQEIQPLVVDLRQALLEDPATTRALLEQGTVTPELIEEAREMAKILLSQRSSAAGAFTGNTQNLQEIIAMLQNASESNLGTWLNDLQKKFDDLEEKYQFSHNIINLLNGIRDGDLIAVQCALHFIDVQMALMQNPGPIVELTSGYQFFNPQGQAILALLQPYLSSTASTTSTLSIPFDAHWQT